MIGTVLNRRAVLRLAGTTLALALLSGCATRGTVSPEAKGAPIGAVTVSGSKNRTLVLLAPLVAEELKTQLGARYAPGARGGATLAIELTGSVLSNDEDDDFIRFDSPDQLEGKVTLTSARHETIASFPLLVSTPTISHTPITIYPDMPRLQQIARSYAHWTIGRLS